MDADHGGLRQRQDDWHIGRVCRTDWCHPAPAAASNMGRVQVDGQTMCKGLARQHAIGGVQRPTGARGEPPGLTISTEALPAPAA